MNDETMTTIERPRLDVPMHDRIKALPRDHRGFPVPWFVDYVDGKPYFPALDARKLRVAVKQSRCWICGQMMTGWKIFVVGPMCVANRISAEPPCHLDCAQYAVRVCPFMVNPKMRRVPETKHPEGYQISEMHNPRNPGVMALYHARTFTTLMIDVPVCQMGPPIGGVSWWTEGRRATRAEVEPAVETGLAFLAAQAAKECGGTVTPEAQRDLDLQRQRACDTLPSA